MKKALIVFVLVLASGCSVKVKQDEHSRIKLPDPSGKPVAADKPVDSDKPAGGQMPQVTAANEIAAMARLRSIAVAEMAYFAEQGKYASLDELVQMGLLNDPSVGKLRGYRFEVKVKQNSFEATAVPENFPVTGRRSFYIDDTGVMRAAERGGAAATASDPEVY
jgi:hypothetical protein